MAVVKGESQNLQEYLDEFNEELERTEQLEHGEDIGTYFVDEEGQIYFQPTTDETTAPDDGKAVPEPPPSEDAQETADADEVCYVYIVEEAKDGDDKEDSKGSEVDMTVYDFDEDVDENGQRAKETSTTAKRKTPAAAKIHQCPHCDYSNAKRMAVHAHMKVHSDEKPYKCSVCSKGFRSLAGLNNHENVHSGNKPYRCKMCDGRFTTSGEILRHIRYRHSKIRPHKCDECDYAAVELSKLRRHQRSHTGERPYQCPHCTYASPDTFKLKRHLRVHTGERPYKCEICSAAFTQSNSLKAHRLTHFPEDRPVFQCALCPVACGRKADLRGHISKLHTSTKPYECKRCGKHLPDKYSYNQHSKSHTGEKSYKCTICSYASISKLHLMSHMYIHTNEKPFECDQCNYRSRQKQLLKRHKNVYHNPSYVPQERPPGSHECEKCNKKFIHIGNLIKHLAVHDPESHVHEEKMALKLGRKKRINQGNQTLEVENEGDEDGHYIVVEVINSDEEREVKPVPVSASAVKDIKANAAEKSGNIKQDMETCFGFDEDDDDMENDE